MNIEGGKFDITHVRFRDIPFAANGFALARRNSESAAYAIQTVLVEQRQRPRSRAVLSLGDYELVFRSRGSACQRYGANNNPNKKESRRDVQSLTQFDPISYCLPQNDVEGSDFAVEEKGEAVALLRKHTKQRWGEHPQTVQESRDPE